MSYIPKYILKRMIPKDAIKALDDGGVEIKMINVISPITIDEVPDNLLDYIEAKLDGNEVSKDLIAKTELEFENDKYQLSNAKEALGKTIPVGGNLIIRIPGVGVKAGEEHEVEVIIKTDNPIDIKVKRTIQ